MGIRRVTFGLVVAVLPLALLGCGTNLITEPGTGSALQEGDPTDPGLPSPPGRPGSPSSPAPGPGTPVRPSPNPTGPISVTPSPPSNPTTPNPPGTPPGTPIGNPPPPNPDPPSATVALRLVAGQGAASGARVNFGLPLVAGELTDASRVAVYKSGTELATASRALATHADGSVRSVQIQFDLPAGSLDSASTGLEVRIGTTRQLPSPSLVPVEQTLANPDGTTGPRIYVLLPPGRLSVSLAGLMLPDAQLPSGAMSAWARLCDEERFDADAFFTQTSAPDVWLYDRGTVHYRAYARRGDWVSLSSGYRETAYYRQVISGSGTATRIGVPDKATDLKYHYTQNMALHYLLTGDDRFREAAENVALRVSALFPNPGYSGGDGFWTERHAGFALLAYVWAMVVSDDRAATFRNLADEAVEADLAVQAAYPSGYASTDARCFAHTGTAHGEDWSYFGCSPWMSAILADGLDAYASETTGAASSEVGAAIVKLGRFLARHGRDGGGKPYYFAGEGTSAAEVDEFEEHWGETAYIIALAYHYQGRTDAALKTAASEVMTGFSSSGEVPHMRSFNWQCRSAPATPYYLR